MKNYLKNNITISKGLEKSLLNMNEKGLLTIKKFYQNNPRVKQKCKAISDFVDVILIQRKKETQKSG